MVETMPNIPQRIQVPAETCDGTNTPAARVAVTIWRTAIERKTTECTSATMARLRLVRMEKGPMAETYFSQKSGQETVTWITRRLVGGI